MLTLETCKPFRILDANELAALRQIGREKQYSSGQQIFKEGDPGDGVYVLMQGKVEISARMAQDVERVFAEVGPGEIFGEMAVIEFKPRSAGARAAQDSTVFFIPRQELMAMIQRSPVLALELLREFSERLRQFNHRYIQEILQAERLAVLGRFTRSIVHDLKNPLNIIGLSAEMAGMENATPQNRQKFAATIRSQVERISDLVGEILLFTQGARPNYVLGTSDYTAFVQHMAAELRQELELRGVRLESALPPGRVKLAFDPKRLRRVFENLIHNAMDFLPEGGKILVRFRVADNELITDIEDTGPGIAPEIAGKLFEAFATHGKANGTGLGLSICKRIVEDHRGRIWAENRTGGRGAVFSFALPLPQ
ncbi:MAG TPA: ATP-binding protein [Verrucomicrobiae bacterium]|nr:ATP-binding protein [Verrucomicrobiae bacterium]